MRTQQPAPRFFRPLMIDTLLSGLKERGYTTVGPTVRDGAIVYDDIASAADLPVGWTDGQDAGSYRLKRRDDGALFGYVVGPQSWKKYLFPPEQRLFTASRGNGGDRLQIRTAPPPETSYAFIGMRACEIRALAIQDKVFTGGEHVDPYYRALRGRLFIVAVNCVGAGKTCFCVSMNAGPKAESGFDLSLTELLEGENHGFVVEAGSTAGTEILAALGGREARGEELAAAGRGIERAVSQMGRRMDTDGIKDLLYRNFDNRRWDEVARRCLSCSNCTMVCPTCFCHSVEDVTDLAGEEASRVRRWDSCFTMDFSHIYGGSVRPSVSSRYRQWMTHKLATWHDQFDSSGCVGCGRCITWCPVGIDITEEVSAIRDSESAGDAGAAGNDGDE